MMQKAIQIGTLLGYAIIMALCILLLYPYIIDQRFLSWEYIRFGLGIIFLHSNINIIISAIMRKRRKDTEDLNVTEYEIEEVK